MDGFSCDFFSKDRFKYLKVPIGPIGPIGPSLRNASYQTIFDGPDFMSLFSKVRFEFLESKY